MKLQQKKNNRLARKILKLKKKQMQEQRKVNEQFYRNCIDTQQKIERMGKKRRNERKEQIKKSNGRIERETHTHTKHITQVIDGKAKMNLKRKNICFKCCLG